MPYIAYMLPLSAMILNLKDAAISNTALLDENLRKVKIFAEKTAAMYFLM